MPAKVQNNFKCRTFSYSQKYLYIHSSYNSLMLFKFKAKREKKVLRFHVEEPIQRTFDILLMSLQVTFNHQAASLHSLRQKANDNTPQEKEVMVRPLKVVERGFFLFELQKKKIKLPFESTVPRMSPLSADFPYHQEGSKQVQQQLPVTVGILSVHFLKINHPAVQSAVFAENLNAKVRRRSATAHQNPEKNKTLFEFDSQQ